MKQQFKKFKHQAKETLFFQVLKLKVKPKRSFVKSTTPQSPKYSELDHWAAHPQKENHSDTLISGGSKNEAHEVQADVFYIYPTVYFGQKTWNAPLDHERTNEFVDHMLLPGQASVFNENCRVFAPRYRQATFYSFLNADANSQQAFDLAFSDIKQAFTHYLDHWNDGRPFIIAGHSQGTFHGIRLLEEAVESSTCIDQFIAAYLIGFQIPHDKFGRTLHRIKPAKSETDLGCVIAYDTFGEKGGPLHKKDECQHFYPDTNTWEYRKNKNVIGINPLNWKTDTTLAVKEQHLGGARMQMNKESSFNLKEFFSEDPMGLEFKRLSEPITEECEARLDEQGFLHISKPKTRSFRIGLLPNFNYHVHDYSLFYMNLRENVGKRVEAWVNEGEGLGF